jgi:hypothetical protein
MVYAETVTLSCFPYGPGMLTDMTWAHVEELKRGYRDYMGLKQ